MHYIVLWKKYVNDLITNGKKLFLKSTAHVQVYKDCLPEVPLPPEPVITRCGTWLNADSFYQEHFNEVKGVVGKLKDDYACVRELTKCLKETPYIKM